MKLWLKAVMLLHILIYIKKNVGIVFLQMNHIISKQDMLPGDMK